MDENIIKISRELRKRQTPSEKTFWDLVRNKKLGVKFLRQFVLHYKSGCQDRFFIADFYCSEKKLVVEIDGCIHQKQKDYDEIRSHIINELGIQVIRFKNDEINDITHIITTLNRFITKK